MTTFTHTKVKDLTGFLPFLLPIICTMVAFLPSFTMSRRFFYQSYISNTISTFLWTKINFVPLKRNYKKENCTFFQTNHSNIFTPIPLMTGDLGNRDFELLHQKTINIEII